LQFRDNGSIQHGHRGAEVHKVDKEKEDERDWAKSAAAEIRRTIRNFIRNFS